MLDVTEPHTQVINCCDQIWFPCQSASSREPVDLVRATAGSQTALEQDPLNGAKFIFDMEAIFQTQQ